jgi:AmiR/NasT family two-component response regulator
MFEMNSAEWGAPKPNSSGGPRGSFAALGISAHREDLDRLREIFSRMNWILREARSRHEAGIVLCSHRMPVIICDRHLPDGHWTDIMSLVAPLVEPPCVIVMSDEVDRCSTSEVINMGGYGILRKPLNEVEAIHVLVAAHRSWQTIWRGGGICGASAA